MPGPIPPSRPPSRIPFPTSSAQIANPPSPLGKARARTWARRVRRRRRGRGVLVLALHSHRNRTQPTASFDDRGTLPSPKVSCPARTRTPTPHDQRTPRPVRQGRRVRGAGARAVASHPRRAVPLLLDGGCPSLQTARWDLIRARVRADPRRQFVPKRRRSGASFGARRRRAERRFGSRRWGKRPLPLGGYSRGRRELRGRELGGGWSGGSLAAGRLSLEIVREIRQ